MICKHIEKFKKKEHDFANKNKRNYVMSYIFWYTLIFGVLSILAFYSFYKAGKGFVWIGETKDGLVQHYNSLVYYGEYLREIIRNLFKEGKLILPTYDFNIGMGGDILATFQYYAIGDPLNIVSVLVPRRYTEFLYEFLILFRLYLSGLAFSAFSFEFKKDRFSVMIGAFLYAFSSFAMFAAVRHPFFANALLYLALVLWGVERIFKGKRPYIYILSVFVAASANFYFFYMISILMVIYAAFRFFMIYKENRMRYFWKNILRFGIYYGVGLMMSGILFLTIAGTLFATNRMSNNMDVSMLYSLRYYKRMVSTFLTYGSSGREWVACAVTPIQLVCIALLYRKKEEYKNLRGVLYLFTIFLMFPIFGYAMNGFSYVANKWCFGYCFLTSFITVVTLKDLIKISEKFWKYIFGATIVLCGLSVWPDFNRNVKIMASVALVLAGVVVLYICFAGKNKAFYRTFKAQAICLVLVGVIVFAEGDIVYRLSGYQNEFAGFGDAEEMLDASALNGVKKLENQDEFGRFEEAYNAKSFLTNAGVYHDVGTTSYFWSVASPHYYEYTSSIGNKDTIEQALRGLDGKTMPLALANVKYYVSNVKKESVPYGFAKEPERIVKVKGEKIGYYKNELFLPFGYTYENYISRNEYDQLDDIERQQAAMQTVVLEKEADFSYNHNLKLERKELPYTISYGNDVMEKDGVFYAKSNGKVISIGMQPSEEYEMHVYMNGVEHTAMDNLALSKMFGDYTSLRMLKRKALERDAKNWLLPIRGNIEVSSGDSVKKTITYRTKDNSYYSARGNYDINLGMGENLKDEIKIKLVQKGAYKLNDIKIVGVPMKDYKEQVQKLSEETLQNLQVGNNKLSGDISVSKEKMLCISLPYSEGWKAYVDGKEVEVYQANVGYMGLLLEKGEHYIEMKYETPWLHLGVVCSIVGLIGFVGVVILTEVMKKKQKKAVKN